MRTIEEDCAKRGLRPIGGGARALLPRGYAGECFGTPPETRRNTYWDWVNGTFVQSGKYRKRARMGVGALGDYATKPA